MKPAPRAEALQQPVTGDRSRISRRVIATRADGLPIWFNRKNEEPQS